jgi:putative Holliday junction resolvase
MNGTVGPAAERVRQFISKLERRFKLPVVAVDERLSTVEAEEILIARGIRREKRKQMIDSLAAAVILQQYLDAESNRC